VSEEIEGKLLAALSLMRDETLVEYVLQQDYYTRSDWEEVAQFELSRRGKGDLPKLKEQAQCVHAPIFVHEGVCKACGKQGLK
jgi:hypothetical protein